MNLNIIIPEDTAQFLNSCATSQGEDLAGFAGHVLTRLAKGEPIILRSTPSPAVTSPLNGHNAEQHPTDIEARTMRARTHLAEIAQRQRVVPLVFDASSGVSDEWPPEESIDDFLQTIREQRQASLPRELP